MTYRKLKADYLFDGYQLRPRGSVLLCGQDGKIENILEEDQAGSGVEQFNGLIVPGFINCHCHLELSHMRGLIPEKTGLVDFVFSVVTQRHFREEEILNAIELAENEMLQNGIVAVGDISNNLLTLQQKQQRKIRYYNFIEASGWLPTIAQQRFESSLYTYDRLSPISSASVVPHAPYSVSNQLWQLIKPFYQNKVVSIHNQETVFEDELFLQNSGDFARMYEMMKLDTSFFKPSGKSSLQTYFNRLSNAAHVLLVHNTFIKQEDVTFVKKERGIEDVSFCLCVNANQYIEQAMPPIDMLRGNGCRIVLGTDSLASNWSLNMMDEIKTINKHFPDIPIEEMLTWATSNGAKALQMDDQLGSFEKDKQPGIVLLEGLDVEETASLHTAVPKRLF